MDEADMNPLDDDEIIAEDEIQGPAAPPSHELAEDLDGNWQRPVRQRVRALPKPVTPTRPERERHRLTHIPFADWCVHCVRCKGRNLPHRRVEPLPEAGTVPVVSMDLAFIKRSDSEQALPFIVTRDRRTRLTFSHLLQGKSTLNAEYSDYVFNAMVQDLRYLDYGTLILKSDQEGAMKALYERVRRARSSSGEKTIVEHSPVGESQSNGVVEQAIKDVKEQLGTILAALEESLGGRVPQESAIIAWAIEYSSTLLNYFKEGADGKTPLERHRGEKHERPLAEFGEKVLYLPLDRHAHPVVQAPEPRYEEGFWLGMDVRTTEVIIGTATGIVRARAIRRRPEDERWCIEGLLKITGTPWDPSPGMAPEHFRAAVLPPPDAEADDDAPEQGGAAPEAEASGVRKPG